MSWLTRGFDPPSLSDPVPATALVIGPDLRYSGFTHWSATIQLLVTTPGTPPYVVNHQEMVTREQAPLLGVELPVMTERSDPSRLAIQWHQVPTIEDRIGRSDPAIVDPAGTWDRVEKARAAITPALVPRPAPWGDGSIPDWPGTPKIGRRRIPGTAMVVAHSDDPSPYMIGNEFHYDDRYSYRGQLESDPIGYFAWLLLLVIATNGQRYALQKRMHVRSGRLGPLLAVTIKEDKPTDVDVEWKHTAKKPALTLADAASQATGLSPGLDFSGLPAGIADRLSALGFATDGVPAQAAPPDPTVDLSRLEQLRATGVLTDEEYQAERSRIIANI